MTESLSSLAYYGECPTGTGKIKAQAEHFQVVEQLGYEFSGTGEHLMLQIRKTGENTRFVANELAKACGVRSQEVGWAGLKDRHAVTVQWLSLPYPQGQTPDLTDFLQKYPHIQVLQMQRHHKKLRPGELQGNEFSIVLSELSDPDEALSRLARIAHIGVPNYFGQQRFGQAFNNVQEARRWGRDNVRTRNQTQRSMYLSAARAWIFNRIVSTRLEQGCFDQCLTGDIVLTPDESHLVLANELVQWNQKITTQQAQISAALAGDNALPTAQEALALEQACVDAEPDLMALIRGNRMRHERRAICLRPQDFCWQVHPEGIEIHFSLAAGEFATAIIREVINEVAVERHYD